jgi:hypothetical protein
MLTTQHPDCPEGETNLTSSSCYGFDNVTTDADGIQYMRTYVPQYGPAYSDPGATALDQVDEITFLVLTSTMGKVGIASVDVTVASDGTDDTNGVEPYLVQYSVTDASLNDARAAVRVVVVRNLCSDRGETMCEDGSCSETFSGVSFCFSVGAVADEDEAVDPPVMQIFG